MRLDPRTACRLRLSAFVVLALALLSTSVWAQQQRERAQRIPATQTKNAERAKLTQALTLLIETADKARLFDDLLYRARVQALAADALWSHDERRCSVLTEFLRQWRIWILT